MTRKEFIVSNGATCKNWNWSWSFINAWFTRQVYRALLVYHIDS